MHLYISEPTISSLQNCSKTVTGRDNLEGVLDKPPTLFFATFRILHSLFCQWNFSIQNTCITSILNTVVFRIFVIVKNATITFVMRTYVFKVTKLETAGSKIQIDVFIFFL